jgi:hypothetical protein
MEDFNCRNFEILVRFNERDFKKKDFLADIKPKGKTDFFLFHYGSKTKENKNHAHLEFFFDKKDSFFKMTFHQGESPAEDVREPYLEDAIKWLGGFFKKEVVSAEIKVAFSYGDEYESIVLLQYPLQISNRYLQGVNVAGFRIVFPEESLPDSGFITPIKDVILVGLFTDVKKLNLTEFDFYSNVEGFSRYASAFVMKKGEK